MLGIIRLILAAIFVVFTTLFALIYCLFSPRNPKHVYFFCRWFNQLHKLIGLKLIQRGLDRAPTPANSVYISNHQSVYDFVTAPGMLRPRTVSLGKKDLLWIPFFGQLYWITGNILINRENKSQARDTIKQVAEAIHQRDLSVWVYPEGTRSKGRGLLPFKTGAFRMAIEAGVPITPMCVSTTHNKIDLNRRDNGVVISEMLEPIDVSGYKIEDARKLAEHCHTLMASKIKELDNEVAQLERQNSKSLSGEQHSL
ncbi:acyl-phosphate glycerol 3-phosphate acyltransferase [Vibrio coralliilyticus]|uniref:1-acyl-sn-glycerol-3-phosphate acyltransferase n=1 Tax=Vibrio coralliilyticus TaxID=190893 RepID=A0A7Y3YV19_9VIBR|nr:MULTISPECIES: 1-acylglycerol-3-phosphate O-acyltransferase [Vibrio]AIW18035.1 acyl-phosphate glycerol 3-phosphate acyltransferase [Vibrio coralliilyticus]ANW23738.1 acyl-phosphate glycerol 3-phosphate acyltransferase [Vibrio coralliilyticus]KJY77334.1 acyl-phosphate glycerol 3-phosphate acyltransferase [Vibrio coralliilyticus]MCC2522793.1 1-acylglycerol-3-phosphate O-acyltransferase [Vibrio coralliilyticus]MCM5509843.1 1-acylglycerol-3-phosphate O-acyltransferase [Vibrio sp. SCSIO 43169]